VRLFHPLPSAGLRRRTLTPLIFRFHFLSLRVSGNFVDGFGEALSLISMGMSRVGYSAEVASGLAPGSVSSDFTLFAFCEDKMAVSAGSSTVLQTLLERGTVDPEACAQVLAHSWDRLTRLTRKMLRQFPHVRRWEQTEDVFQAAAMRLFSALAVVQPENTRAFLGLAATQIRRTLIDLARHHYGPLGSGAHHQSDPALPDRSMREASAPQSTEPGSLEDWATFHEIIERLPADMREVFCLRWYHGMSQDEIARVLNVSVPTVQRKWYAAQIELHDRLQGQMPGGG